MIEIYTPAELEAYRLWKSSQCSMSTEESDIREGARLVLELAERIKNERALAALHGIYNQQ